VPLKSGLGGRWGHLRSLKMAPIDRLHTTLYWSTVVSCNYSSCTIFEYLGVRSGPKMSENAQFWRWMHFSTKYLRTYLRNHPETPFWGTFQINANPIIQRALRQSHVNGATPWNFTVIGIGKYLGCVKIFPLRGFWGAQGPLLALMYICDPPWYIGNYYS